VQEVVQPTVAQTGAVIGHIVEQLWQCAGWVMSISQPSSAVALQWAQPEAHALGGITQRLAEQVTPVIVPTWESAVQS
jgi:hypothetical protein